MMKVVPIIHRDRVRVEGNISNKFKVKEGLHQGVLLSSIMSNLILKWVIRKLKINSKAIIPQESPAIGGRRRCNTH